MCASSLKFHELATTAADAGKDIILAGGVAVEVAVSEASKQTVTSIAYLGDLGRQFATACVMIAVASLGIYVFVRLWRRLDPPFAPLPAPRAVVAVSMPVGISGVVGACRHLLWSMLL